MLTLTIDIIIIIIIVSVIKRDIIIKIVVIIGIRTEEPIMKENDTLCQSIQ